MVEKPYEPVDTTEKVFMSLDKLRKAVEKAVIDQADAHKITGLTAPSTPEAHAIIANTMMIGQIAETLDVACQNLVLLANYMQGRQGMGGPEGPQVG